MPKTYFFIFVLIIASCKSNLNSTTQSLFPENINSNIINDYSDILSEEEKANLSKKLNDYEIVTTNQIAIVTVDSIVPYKDIQKYAGDLLNYWSVGQKDTNNGLMIVLSKPLKQVGIATGYGTEKILTDSKCKHAIETTMIPYFKEDKYYEGFLKGLDSLIYKWDR